eukprot:s20_g35.t1
MGRWDVEQRVWCESNFWKELRHKTMELIIRHLPDEKALDRACFEMAVKGESGCGLVQHETLKNNLRILWIGLLKKHGSRQQKLDYKATGQPFYLRLLKELLSFAGDADHNFLLQGETGFPVAIITPLPRTPHIFEKSRRVGSLKMIRTCRRRQHFAEECAEGMMEKISLEEAKARYGDKEQERVSQDTAMLRTLLLFLAQRFDEGGSLQEAPPLPADDKAEDELVFFTDAKATEHGAWIGGFKCDSSGKVLAWFSEEIDADWADWLRYRQDPKRVIASLELLASLIALKLWMPEGSRDLSAKCWIREMMDNLSNTFAVAKFMSTKFPLIVLVMELSENLRISRCFLRLAWVPRESN